MFFEKKKKFSPFWARGGGPLGPHFFFFDFWPSKTSETLLNLWSNFEHCTWDSITFSFNVKNTV